MTSHDDRLRILKNEHRRLAVRLEGLEASRRRAAGPLPADTSEQAPQRGNDVVVDELEAVARAEIAQLERAMERIAQQRGDACEDCGQSISAARLAVLPAATRCRGCQESHASR